MTKRDQGEVVGSRWREGGADRPRDSPLTFLYPACVVQASTEAGPLLPHGYFSRGTLPSSMACSRGVKMALDDQSVVGCGGECMREMKHTLTCRLQA